MPREFTEDDDALLGELGVEVEVQHEGARTPREERIIAGFEEIQRFVEEHRRAPQHGHDRPIFERLYAVRLDRLRDLEDARNLLAPLDHQNLLTGTISAGEAIPDDIEDDELLAQLGVDDVEEGGIADLRHVRTATERREAEEIATRERCEDFATFKPLFAQVQKEIDAGIRQTRPFELKAEIQAGSWFIVNGQKAYVAEAAETFTTAQGHTDARLRVIFDNGTQSNMLMRSLQRALHKDDAGRRITNPEAGPLFSGTQDAEDQASGTIYVLRSKSDHPLVAAKRNLVHKIGVTGGKIEQRIAGAASQPTFLMADVEIVASYQLFNINRTKLENLIHRIFHPARFEIEITDRFGGTTVPREWFLVPLFVIDDAVEKIKDGSIVDYVYDPMSASLIRRSD